MPFIFMLVGIMFLVIAVRNQTTEALTLLKGEFIGPKSFVPWIIALSIIGAIGYINPIKPISQGFMALIILVMIVTNNKNKGSAGLFAQFENALQNTTPSPTTNGNTSISTDNQSATNGTGAIGGTQPVGAKKLVINITQYTPIKY